MMLFYGQIGQQSGMPSDEKLIKDVTEFSFKWLPNGIITKF